MKQILYSDGAIYAATTLKDQTAPENNNMALHVCLDPEKVMINRRSLEQETGLPLENWALPWQKHTDKFARVIKEDRSKGAFDKNTSIMDVDAVYTTEPDTLIGVFTADCAGIILADEKNGCIAAIHSGWKGTAQEIVWKTVTHLIDEGLIDPAAAKAWFSPSILKDSLEVGMEVIDQIRDISSVDPEPYIRIVSSEKGYIDNQGLNAAMLIQAGLLPENIFLSKMDTKKELEDCFSFRNDKKTGEHFTYAYLRSQKENVNN